MFDQSPETDFVDLVHTLREAEALVQGQLQELTGPAAPNVAGLRHLRRSVQELADQAQFLTVAMLDSNQPLDLMRRDGTLLVFFREAEQQIARRLGEEPVGRSLGE